MPVSGQGKLAALVVAIGLVLVGCGAAPPAPMPSASESSSESPESVVAAVGEPALDASCTDLVDEAALRAAGDANEDALALALDERRIAQRLAAAARLQAGDLRCVWSSNFGGTDFARSVSVVVTPSTESSVAASTDASSAGPWRVAPDGSLEACTEPAAIVVVAESTSGSCSAILVAAGYRVDIEVSSHALPTRDAAWAWLADVRTHLVAALEAAPAPREIPAVGPAELSCSDPRLVALVAARGGGGEPEVRGDGAITWCSWPVPDPTGMADGFTLDVGILADGAGLLEVLADGVGLYPLWFEPLPGEPLILLGTGDAIGAFVAVGPDLVEISGPAGADDPAAWVADLTARF